MSEVTALPTKPQPLPKMRLNLNNLFDRTRNNRPPAVGQGEEADLRQRLVRLHGRAVPSQQVQKVQYLFSRRLLVSCGVG